jgi:hypothetical protein
MHLSKSDELHGFNLEEIEKKVFFLLLKNLNS